MGDAMRMALEDSGPPITPVPSAGQLVQDDPPSLSASPPEGGIHPALARQSRLAIAHPCEREGEVRAREGNGEVRGNVNASHEPPLQGLFCRVASRRWSGRFAAY